ncbi:hypothetical protein ACSBR1_027238 [Camellia fascicularis]
MGHYPFRHSQLCFFGSTSLTALRWKEQYFVNVGTDCGLTIAGFYYVCFSCSDCSINGFYYDPNSRYAASLFTISDQSASQSTLRLPFNS